MENKLYVVDSTTTAPALDPYDDAPSVLDLLNASLELEVGGEALAADLAPCPPWRSLPPATATVLTLGQWLAHDRAQDARSKSVAKTLGLVINRIPDDFLSLRLGQISRRHFVALFCWLRTVVDHRGKRLMGTTLHMFRSTIAASLERALDHELISYNPARIPAHVLPPDRPGPAFQPQNQHLSVAEATRLVSSERIAIIRRVGYAIELYTGVRISELLGLRWSSYTERDPDGSLLGFTPERYATRDLAGPELSTLSIEMQWHDGEFGPTKTGDVRIITVHPELARLLRWWREVRWPDRPRFHRVPGLDDLIVPGFFRGRLHPQCPDRYNERLEKDLKAVGIRVRTSHALRKSMLQLLIDAGAIKEAVETLTHRERKNISSVYTRWSPELVAREVLKHPVRIALPKAQLDLFDKGDRP